MCIKEWRKGKCIDDDDKTVYFKEKHVDKIQIFIIRQGIIFKTMLFVKIDTPYASILAMNLNHKII